MQLTPQQTIDLTNKIELLAEMFNRRLSGDALSHWLNTLSPLYGTPLSRVLGAAMNERSFPSLGSVLEAVNAVRASLTPMPSTLRQLTVSERERSDLSRKKSGLWLHYRGASLSALAAFGLGTEVALESAKAEYDQSTINAWMQAQEQTELDEAQPKRLEPRRSWQDIGE